MKRIFTLFFSLTLLFSISQAQTYTTMADGSLEDPAIWSLDGGVTSCSCLPITSVGGVLVFNKGTLVDINHHINTDKHTIIYGLGGLIINLNAGSSFINTDELELRSGVLNVHSSMDIAKITVYNSGFLNVTGTMTVDPGDLINAFQGRIEISGQVYVPTGGISNDGWITMRSNAQVVAAQDLFNTGTLDMEPGSCINLYGEVINNSSVNLINGPGTSYVQSGGNISNLSVWGTSVDWCAAGAGVGLSHSSNCANCGTLPVELVNFQAELDNGQVSLDWSTEKEIQNSHFTLERSYDGITFETLTEVLSTSPETGATYQATDFAPFYGVSWYRLSQTDLNGSTSMLETVMINNTETATSHFNAFPNPFEGTVNVTTFGMEGKAVTIQLLDISGRVVASEVVDQTTDYTVYDLQPGELVPGIYVVRITGQNISESHKLLHK